jgi:hypothetical protein
MAKCSFEQKGRGRDELEIQRISRLSLRKRENGTQVGEMG